MSDDNTSENKYECPECGKVVKSIQGMYGHYGRPIIVTITDIL